MSQSEQMAPEVKSEKKTRKVLFSISTWGLTAVCFYLVWGKIDDAAARENQAAIEYLLVFFGQANWLLWLAVMIPYSVFFFLVDAHVTWRVIRWFNVSEIKLNAVLPIRASAYILSLVNEQVGKGAMSLYLLRRHQVPGWAALSSMIFLGVMEIYQLLIFSSIGVLLGFEVVVEASSMLPLDVILPTVFIVAAIYLPIHIAYFRGHLFKKFSIRDKGVFHALRQGKPRHYLLTLLFKAPNLIGAVVVYTVALELFQVDVNLGQMLAFLPVIFLAAALPLPFHAGALLLWTVLFPEYPEVGAFSLVMHTFFVMFNAVIGTLFLPRANRELFG